MWEETKSFELTAILGSSVVERSAVNRLVVGSNPTRGVKKKIKKPSFF